MAQSFHNVFGYGSDSKYISTVDIDGVNMAAIKALYKKSIEIERQIEQYQKLLKEKELLEKRINQLEKRVEKL